jgi:hypothetical protein
MRFASDLLARAKFAARAGITFQGKRDLYEVLGYPRLIHPKDYRDRYERQGIAARVVEALPKATWRGGAELVEDEDPEVETAFEEAWFEIEKRLKVWSAFQRTDILAGVGHYAVLLIGAPGELEQELPKRLRSEDLLYLQPYAEDEASVLTLDDSPESERYGLPVIYQLTRRTVSGTSFASRVNLVTRRVHYSRVLHIADELLDDRVYGQPRLKRIWNNLDDLDKVSGGGAEAFWRRVHQGTVFNLDKDLEIDAADAAKVEEAAEEMVHDLRRVMAVRGMEVTQLGSDVANFSNPVDSILTLIAGATGIPKRILMGSERGELASSQDRENWNQRVTDRRTDFAGPCIVRPFVDKLVGLGALPEPEEYEVRWPEMEALSETEQAVVAGQWAELNEKAKGIVVLPAEIRDRVLRLDPLSPEEIAAFEEEQAAKAQEAVERQQQAMGEEDGEEQEEDSEDDEEEDEDEDGSRTAARFAYNPYHEGGTGRFAPAPGGAAPPGKTTRGRIRRKEYNAANKEKIRAYHKERHERLKAEKKKAAGGEEGETQQQVPPAAAPAAPSVVSVSPAISGEEHGLRSSPVAKVSDVNREGHVNEVYVVTLENGQKGIFKPPDTEWMRPGIRVGAGPQNEAGAWEVAKLVGMDDLVAPTVVREVSIKGKGTVGSLQAFVAGKDAGRSPDRDRFNGNRDLQRAAMFDFVIGNQDRHPGNWRLREDGRLGLIDHGLSFGETKRAGGANALLHRAAIRARREGWTSANMQSLAKTYGAKKPEIHATLLRAGVPRRAADRVMKRIDRAQGAPDWYWLFKDGDPPTEIGGA